MCSTKLKLTLGLAAAVATNVLAQPSTPAPAVPPAPTNAPAAPATATNAAPAPADQGRSGGNGFLKAYDNWNREVKNPVSWFSWGADFRFRNEYFNNAITLNEDGIRHEQDYFRFRERIWATVLPVTNVSLNARFSGEQREWMKPSYASQFDFGEGLEWRYGILDNAYAKWSNIGNVPLTISAGRQDVQFGEPLNWWLVGDGTPDDGSWTFFLDSIRANYDIKDLKTKVDVVYIYQQARPDATIPTVGESSDNKPTPYMLTEQNEQGVIFYLSNKSINNMQLDGYFIYKRDDKELAYGDNANIYTIGSKVSGTPTTNWAYSVEGAYQFGDKQDATVLPAYTTSPTAWRNIDAYGANARLTYLCRDKLNNQFSFAVECLSGDNPNTKGTDEMFDVLWGRWPRWSELYIYSYINETSRKIAQMNNIIRFGPTWVCTPIKNTTFSATYNPMFAIENTPTRAANPTLFSDDGTFRGHYLQTVLKHKFNEHLSGHLWAEFVWMGDYYTHNNCMTFLRGELLYTF
ncbi:MAG TPA: alginate export family protein [Candidatus Acidoferrum sp.]|nr:alginate export family protein [Candidatus Acidoferrum sp.]